MDPVSMDLAYPPRLQLAQLPTPLQALPRISKAYGGGHRIWVKRDDLTGAALSGNKLRKLEFVTALAREQGCDTLITCGGVQSNHCRATALAGAQLGFGVHLILRGEAPEEIDGNLLLDHLAGARVSHYSRSRFGSELDIIFREWEDHYRNRGYHPFSIPIGASDGVGIWGYIAGAEELGKDLQKEGIEGAHIVCASGSGGTQAGLSLGAVLHGLDLDVWGFNVCDDEAWFQAKIAADMEDWKERYRPHEALPDSAVRVIDGYVGPGYGRADAEVFDTIAMAARLEGLVLDPVYTGKAFHGMLEEIRLGRFAGRRDIVFIHTGGIFGLFPLRNGFEFPAQA
jgi:D-cysteine desulfhydrase